MQESNCTLHMPIPYHHIGQHLRMATKFHKLNISSRFKQHQNPRMLQHNLRSPHFIHKHCSNFHSNPTFTNFSFSYNRAHITTKGWVKILFSILCARESWHSVKIFIFYSCAIKMWAEADKQSIVKWVKRTMNCSRHVVLAIFPPFSASWTIRNPKNLPSTGKEWSFSHEFSSVKVEMLPRLRSLGALCVLISR